MEKVKSSNTKENVNAQELQIIKLMRELDYGQLVVSVKTENLSMLKHARALRLTHKTDLQCKFHISLNQ